MAGIQISLSGRQSTLKKITSRYDISMSGFVLQAYIFHSAKNSFDVQKIIRSYDLPALLWAREGLYLQSVMKSWIAPTSIERINESGKLALFMVEIRTIMLQASTC